MGVTSKISSFFKGIKSRWSGSEARAITEEDKEDAVSGKDVMAEAKSPETVKKDTGAGKPEESGPVVPSAMGRGLVTGDKLRALPGYSSVSHNGQVKKLIENADNFESLLKHIKTPDFNSLTPDKICAQAVEDNSLIVSALSDLSSDIVSTYMYLNGKRWEKYKFYAGQIGGLAMILNQQQEFAHRVLDHLLEAARDSKTDNSKISNVSYENIMQNLEYTQLFRADAKTERDFIGKGGINSVYAMKDTTSGGRKRVVKEGHYNTQGGTEREVIATRLRGRSYDEVKSFGSEEQEGEYSYKSYNRDFAVSVIDRLFGLNAAVGTSLGKTETGKTSSMMDVAEGTDAGKALFAWDKESMGYAKLCRNIMANKVYLLNPSSGALTKEEAEQASKIQNTRIYDISNGDFAKSAVSLAALDIIIGHVDRHALNYKMTDKGLKGFDNDTSFGLYTPFREDYDKKLQSGEMSWGDLIDKHKTEEGVASQNGNLVHVDGTALLFYSSAIPKATEQFIDQICSVNVSTVRSALKGLIQPDEVEACAVRVEGLQKYLKSLKGTDKCIPDWGNFDVKEYANKYSYTTGGAGTRCFSAGNYAAQAINASTMRGFANDSIWENIDVVCVMVDKEQPWNILGQCIRAKYSKFSDIAANSAIGLGIMDIIKDEKDKCDDVVSYVRSSDFDIDMVLTMEKCKDYMSEFNNLQAIYKYLGEEHTDDEIRAKCAENRERHHSHNHGVNFRH